MKQDRELTLVVFRVWKGKHGGVLALFPEVRHNHLGHCASYEHVGQHASADYYGCLKRTRPAKWKEWHPLFVELTNLGYRLRERKRWVQIHK